MSFATEPAQPLSWLSAGLASACLHGALALAVLGGMQGLLPEAEAPPDPAGFTVTSISLDPEQLAAIGTLGDPVEPEAVQAEPPPETAALAAEAPVATAAPVAPAERLTASPAAVAPTPAQVLSPVRAETGGTVAARPAPVETLTAAPKPVETATLTPAALTPVEPEAAPPEPASGPEAAPLPSDEDLAEQAALDDLIARIRRQGDTSCLNALPQRAGDGRVRLLLIGTAREAMETVADAILAGLDPAPDRDFVLIDPRQCPALDFVRARDGYPAMRLSLGLTSDAIASGARLTGTIRRAGAFPAALLLIDDNGVVQDLERFTSAGAGVIWFDIPMTRNSEPRGTSALLLALAGPAPSQVIRDRAGLLADEVFPALGAEFSGAAVALVPFELR